MNPFEVSINIPFEDGVFIDFYRNILLRNIPFCEINSKEDLRSCRTLTIQFIQKAMQMAHGVQTKQFELSSVLNYLDNLGEKDKEFLFLYIIYRELYRKGNTSSKELLSTLFKYELNAPFCSIFKSANHYFAWDYLLTYFAQSHFESSLFSVMWIRYQKSLLKCDIDEFESFVNNLYLKDETDKYSILLQEPINQNHEFILERAEMLYVESTIFEI
jgi:hypothetical protein